MKYTPNALNILTMIHYKITKAKINECYKKNMEDKHIVEMMNKHIKDKNIDIDKFCKTREEIESQIKNKFGQLPYKEESGLIAIGDDDFPVHKDKVQQIQKGEQKLFCEQPNNIANRNTKKLNDSDSPVLLCYCGDLKLLWHSLNIAVIGLLDPDDEIKTIEQKIVNKFAEHNAVIVSGLANGCDTIAHRQSLDSNATTISVLPSPLDNIIPKSNKGLAIEIIQKGGLLISEYFFEMKKFDKYELLNRYVDRDRLQALFSDMVILSASYTQEDSKKDSGSRHAMEKAKKYGIRRAVIYDERFKDNPKFNLNREIIQEYCKNKYITNNDIYEINKQKPDFKIINEHNVEQIANRFAKYKINN